MRPRRRDLSVGPANAAALLEAWFAYPILHLTPEVVRAAIDVHQRFQVSYWDAAILAAAKRLGCNTVFSEDLNDGQNYDGVTVVNPFKASTPRS
jgi:predicted nucleic acid-binding protein